MDAKDKDSQTKPLFSGRREEEWGRITPGRENGERKYQGQESAKASVAAAN